MSVLYDEAQIAIGEEARRIIAETVSKDRLLALLEQRGQCDETFWATARDQGWTGVAFPEAYGGLGIGLIELGLICFATGAGAVGAPFLTSSFAAGDAIARHGSDQLRQEYLPRLAAGEIIGALAFAERGATLPVRPHLKFSEGRVWGDKPAVIAGAKADVAIVLASDETGDPVLAAVALNDQVSRVVLDTFDNSRCAADLIFDGAPAVALEKGPAARQTAIDVLARLAILVAHEQAGGADAMMRTARDYAVQRRAFGQVIGAFQSVKHRIAELYALVELARANAIHAAAVAETGELVMAAAAARLASTEAYDTASRDCIQVHGGIGVTWELGLHLHQRRSRSLASEAGSSIFWEDVLVERLIQENAP